MNNGKICVSICAETADEMIENIRRAEKFADVVEVRFDCLRTEELDPLLPRSCPGPKNVIVESAAKPIISTFRPKEQGGHRDLSMSERKNFWNSGHETDYCDLEEEFVDDSWSWLWGARICSYHDFSGVPQNIEEIFDRLAITDADIIKIAVRADEITDAIPVWKLLEYVKSYKQKSRPKVIPIAMGEAGKWTRILGLAHGAFLTYASLEGGSQTAPGQITAQEMVEVYRSKELDLDTNVYGVVGGDTSYSLSPLLHNAAFRSNGMNSVLAPLQVANFDTFFTRMVSHKTREVDLNFKGFAVTNPHKQTIIPYLDAIDETASRIGAVNTVMIEDGRFYGYNTDAEGFIQPLKAAYGELAGSRVAVFGAGGAARACIYALQAEAANVTLVARNEEKGKILAEEFGIAYRKPSSDRQLLSTDFDIVVNTTPVGTAGPSADLSILQTEQLNGIKLLYDLVYNPSETLLIRRAKEAGVPTIGGIEMLIAQGARQFEIWTGLTSADRRNAHGGPETVGRLIRIYAARSIKLSELRRSR